MSRLLVSLWFLLALGPPPLPWGAPPPCPHPPLPSKSPEPERLTQIFFNPREALADPAYTLVYEEGGWGERPGVILTPALLERLVKKYARALGVEENLVRAVLQQESGGDPRAVSPKGALGLMQLMPATARAMGVKDAFDPEENLAGGVRYLKQCLTRFQHDVALALAAYNAGPGAVARFQDVPPYRETEGYVAAITGKYLGKAWSRREREPSPPAPQKKESGLTWKIPPPTWKIPPPQLKVADRPSPGTPPPIPGAGP